MKVKRKTERSDLEIEKNVENIELERRLKTLLKGVVISHLLVEINELKLSFTFT